MKKIIISILTLSIAGIVMNGNVHALTYSDNIGINFTFNPSLTVSLSSPDLVINNLTPGTTSDSNIVDIDIATNNVAGYTLFGTVGSSNNNTTSLIHGNSNSTFTSLSTSDSVPDLSTYDTPSLTNPNVWGYSYSTNNNPTGDNITWSNYSGLPLYTTAGTTLKEKRIPGNDRLKFKIAAKSSPTQPAGEYTNTINFTVAANVQDFYFMQDFTNQLCSTLATDDNYTVYDYRDGNDYTVRYINGNCWMTQNLRITGTISAQYSNFTGDDFNASQGDLDQTAGICSGAWCNSYSTPMIYDSGNTANGVWYNYAAASAGTIVGEANTDEATEDICPAGWRLPDRATSAHAGSINSIVSYKTFFAPIYGGYYHGSVLNYPDTYGIWWTSTAAGGNARYGLRYNNDSLGAGNDYYSRVNGAYIRCTIR